MTRQPQRVSEPIIVGLGEALFDCFDSHRKLGGAPVNFAIHAQQLLGCVGGKSCVVSRVGSDDLGQEIKDSLNLRGVDITHLQDDLDRPTGVVQVALDAGGQPTYEIREQVAWDYIEMSPLVVELASRCDAVCFGTLAQRSPTSRDTIRQFLRNSPQALCFLDVNLRQSYFDAEIIESSLRYANLVKFNEEELRESAQLVQLHCASSPEVDEIAVAFCRSFDLDGVVVTRGARGTVLFAEGARFEASVGKSEPEHNADSVGAGDACNAGLLFGWLMGWPKQQVVYLANRMGAFVASRSGATPEIPTEMLQSFQLDRPCDEDYASPPETDIRT